MNWLSVLFQDGSSSSYFTRELFKFGPYANSLDHLNCSLVEFYNKHFISGSTFLTSSMKGSFWNMLLYYFYWPLWFQIVMFGSPRYSTSEWIHCQFCFEMEVHLPVFQGSCLNLELIWILLIIWIAVMVHWHYFMIEFFCRK